MRAKSVSATVVDARYDVPHRPDVVLSGGVLA
jgi:hypothetical protein